MMKIAIIGSFSSKIPISNGQIHAPLSLTYSLAKYLSKMGHEVTYFGSYDKQINKNTAFELNDLNYEALPIKFGKYSDIDIVYHQLRLVYEQGYLSRIFQMSDKFDLFYSWAAFRTGIFARTCPKPIVVTHHDSTHLEYYNYMFKAMNSRNLHLIPISNSMNQQIEHLQKLKVIYNGVDTDKIQPHTPEDSFCWIGRVTPSKGTHIAIDLAKKLGFELNIAGPMDDFIEFGNIKNYTEHIKEEIKNNKNINYLGMLSQEQSYQLLATSKGFIFPSDGTEGCPMTVIESIVAGTPVITTNKGPLPELVDGDKTGFICKSNSEMISAIKNIDKINRQQCRRHGITRFSLDVMTKNYEKEFLKVIKNKV